MKLEIGKQQLSFKDWTWGDLLDSPEINLDKILDEKEISKAIANVIKKQILTRDKIIKEVTKVLQQQAEEDGVSVYLSNPEYEDDPENAVPRIAVDLEFLTLKDDTSLQFTVRLDHLIRDLGAPARNYIPFFKAALTHLESIPPEAHYTEL